MKKIIILFAVFLFTFSLLSQDTTTQEAEAEASASAETTDESLTDEATTLGDQIYQEIIVENFESGTYDNNNISIRVTGEQKVGLALREEFPAPVKDSKKYIGVKVYGKQGDYATIKFSKKLVISKHCQSISMWVYGKNFSGELSLILSDADKKVHRLSFGKLNFLGWRKLTVKLNKNIRQEDKSLAQPRTMEILKMVYSPGSTSRLAKWNYFYIDNISAKVREKYKDEQSDNW